MELDDERTFWTLVLVITAALAYRYMPRWRSRSPFLTPQEVQRRLGQDPDAVVLDVRTSFEFARHTHVPGAINVPLVDLHARLKSHDREMEEMAALKDAAVFVYGTGEAQAARAARMLRERGFTNVCVIGGGIRAWRRSGLPLASARG